MNISRISKAIAEVRGTDKFRDAEGLRQKTMDLFVPADITESVRRMAQTATALILRCFTGTIRVHVPKPDSQLRWLIGHEASKMNALERLIFDPQEIGPLRLGVACCPENAVTVDASGWTARVNGIFTRTLPAAPPAIAFAVSCGVAKLFNMAIFGNTHHLSEAWDFCLLRFTSTPCDPMTVDTNLSLGRVGLLGAGGIGSAVGFVLSLSTWSGQLDIIDFDTFETPNLETCVAAHIGDVNRPLRKALALARVFDGHTIVANEHRREVKHGDPILQQKWDAFLCAVDNPNTRMALDHTNTKLLLNAGLGASKTDAGWVLWTAHGQGNRTLSSVYRQSAASASDSAQVPEEFREECSRKSYNGVALALPFVALAAGSLLVAGVYQNAIRCRPGATFVQMDVFGKQKRMIRQ